MFNNRQLNDLVMFIDDKRYVAVLRTQLVYQLNQNKKEYFCYQFANYNSGENRF